MDADRARLRPVPSDHDAVDSLFGGTDACRRIAGLLGSTAPGDKRALIIRGARGIGKSTILRWAIGYAEREGWNAVLVRPPWTQEISGHELLLEIISGLSHAPAEEFPLDARPSVLRFSRMIESLVDAPILVAVDDLHLLPTDAVKLLGDGLRLANVTAAIVVTTDLGQPFGVAELGAGGDLWVDTFDLSGLSVGAVDRLVRSLAGRKLVASLVRRLHKETAGNPLFIRETVRMWLDRGLLEQFGPYLDEGDSELPFPQSLQDSVALAVDRLGPHHRLVSSILAALERETSFGELLTASSLEPRELAGVLDALEGRAVIVRRERSFRLAHALFERAIQSGSNTAQADDVTSRIVRMLRARRGTKGAGTAQELAKHSLRLLQPPGDIEAIMIAAAEEALESHREAQAAELFGRLAAGQADSGARVGWLVRQARALLRVAPQQALTAIVEARSLRARTCELDEVHGSALLGLGKPQDALAVYEAALQSELSEDVEARIRYGLACARIMMGERSAARPILEELVQAGFASAAGSLAYIEGVDGKIGAALELLERALAGEVSDRERGFLSASLAAFQVYGGRWREARDTIARSLDEAQGAEDQYVFSSLSATAARLYAWQGNIDEATALTSTALRFARATGSRVMIAEACLTWLRIHIEAGTPTQALSFVRSEIEEHPEDFGRKDMAVYELAMADAYAAAGQAPAGETYARRAAERLEREPLWCVALDRVRAELLLQQGDVAGARAMLARWLAQPSECVFEQAQILQAMAEVNRRMRRKSDAREMADTALSTYASLGAQRRHIQLSAWLQKHFGSALRVQKPEPNALSERETEIAKLAVGGLTNAEIAEKLVISAATVKKHIENVLSKTGARRRSDLHRHL